jgi:hypothetical protein
MDKNGFGLAEWCAAGAALLLAWQLAVWLSAWLRWRRIEPRGIPLPPPRFMDGLSIYLATLLADLVPALLALLQMTVGLVWLFFALFAVGLPLARDYGLIVGVAGGLLVLIAGFTLGISTLVVLGQRRRR